MAVYYEPTVAVLKYIAKNPNQSISEIVNGLEGKVSFLEFSGADDFLTDLGVIKCELKMHKDESWAHVYRLCNSINPDIIIKEHLCKLPKKAAKNPIK